MRRLLICVAALAATWCGPLALRTPLAQTATTPAATARVIVKFRADSALLRKQALSVAGQQTLQAAALGRRIGIALDAGRALGERAHVVVGHGLSSRQLASRIAAESDVEYAVADERKHIVEVPNDPLYLTGAAVGATSGGPLVGQWYLRPPGVATGAAGSTAPAAINAEQAWDITKGSASIVVAVLDTGVRKDHPDLQGGNVLAGYDLVSQDSAGVFTTANDGDGRDADPSDPGDWVSSSEATTGCPSANSSWHGTQTLGLIGATTSNGVGIASVTHGGVKMLPVRVLGKCGGFDSDIQAGILWAAGIHVPGVPDNTTPARVINMSLGGAGACTQGYIDAIGQANASGATVVVAAGNSGGNGVSNPANCPGAIGVTALRHVGDKVGYSDLGPEITISAPGGNCVATTGACLYPIATLTNKGTTTPVAGAAGAAYTDSFNPSLGTSFSAPLVSGTVALMLSVKPSLTPAQIKTKLQASARAFPTTGGSSGAITTCTSGSTSQDECYCPNVGPGVTTLCGAGMLDAHAAVLAVSGVQAAISLTTTTPTAGQAVVLTSSSVVDPGQSIASYAWSILNAATTGATITGANDGASVVVTPTAAGSFVIQLVTTDNTGFVSTTTLSVAVAAAGGGPTPKTTPPPSSSSGGGALGIGWLALLLTAVLGLGATRISARRAALSAADRSSRRG